MASIKAVIAIVALSILPTMAAPSREKNLTARAGNADIYFCEHPEWGGACFEWHGGEGCHNVPDGWNDKISSIRREGDLLCKWYKDPNCNGKKYDNQNDAKLQDGSGEFDDVISSWYCFDYHGCYQACNAGCSGRSQCSQACQVSCLAFG